MPTYEYECSKCGVVFDLFQPITESPRRKLKKTDPKPCTCGVSVQRRIGTGGGIIFKGSGFYQTDYRSESYKKGAKAEKDGADGKAKAEGSDGKAKSDAAAPTTSGDKKAPKAKKAAE